MGRTSTGRAVDDVCAVVVDLRIFVQCSFYYFFIIGSYMENYTMTSLILFYTINLLVCVGEGSGTLPLPGLTVRLL